MLRVATVDGADCVNHESRGQIPAGGDHGLACWQSLSVIVLANLLTLFEDLLSTCVVNGAIDAAASEQGGVGRVDDCIDVLASDVANNHDNASIEKRLVSHRVAQH